MPTQDDDLFGELTEGNMDMALATAFASLIMAGEMCAFCHERITPEQKDDPDATYIEVASWVTGPKLQSPVLRGHTGKRAHTECIRKQIDGEAPDQEPVPGLEF